MDFMLLLTIIFIVIIVVLLFKLLKSVLSAVLISIAIISIVLIVGGYFVLKDAKDLSQNFPTQPKLMVLKDNETALAGFRFTDLSEKNSASFSPEEEIIIAQQALDSKDFSELEAKYYKVFVVDMSFFNETLSDGISIGEEGQLNIDPQKVRGAFYSEVPSDALIGSLPNQGIGREEAKQQIFLQLNISSEQEFKGVLFLMAFADALSEKGPQVLVMGLKSKQVKVYPTTAVFRVINYIPAGIIEGVLSQEKNAGEQA